MRAILCREFGPPSALVLAEDAPVPMPGPGQALIRVEAAAANFADTLLIEGKYQDRPPFPFAPGGEVAGRIAALGSGVAGPPPGTRVLAMTYHGGFAEYALAAGTHFVPVPDGIDAVTAAALLYAYGTTLHALRDRAALRPGETVLVLGASGGAGLAAVQVAKAMGAGRVIAAAAASRLDACRAAGADALVDYGAADWRDRVKAAAGPAGVDVVYDPVGGPYAEPALRALGWGGRYLVVGFAAGEIPRAPLNLVLLKEASILGVFYGTWVAKQPEANRALLGQLFDWILTARLRPVIAATHPLEEAPAVLEAMRARRAPPGKSVIRLTPG
jgi:NADPH2:quinone reductase